MAEDSCLVQWAGPPGHHHPAGPLAAPRTQRRADVITPALIWKLVDALQDGIALVSHDGALALANLRLEEMLGYEHGELIGMPVERLVPAHFRVIHRTHLARYADTPAA